MSCSGHIGCHLANVRSDFEFSWSGLLQTFGQTSISVVILQTFGQTLNCSGPIGRNLIEFWSKWIILPSFLRNDRRWSCGIPGPPKLPLPSCSYTPPLAAYPRGRSRAGSGGCALGGSRAGGRVYLHTSIPTIQRFVREVPVLVSTNLKQQAQANKTNTRYRTRLGKQSIYHFNICVNEIL